MGINVSASPSVAQFDTDRQATIGIFRCLVTNRFIHGFNYSTKVFRFRTVFHQSSYSYCCCECAYAHEYVTYISNEGTIDKEIYDKILGCILNGSCPHVTLVSREYTRDTRINALHIAAAANMGLKLKYAYKHINEACLQSAIFDLYPEQLAIWHGRVNFVTEYVKYKNEKYKDSDIGGKQIVNKTMLHATRILGDVYNVQFESISITELCLRTKNIQLLRLIWDQYLAQSCLDQCFEDTNLHEIQSDILNHLRTKRFMLRNDVLTKCAISAIAFDQDLALKYILDLLKSAKCQFGLTMDLPYVCDVLGKPQQKNILTDYGYNERKQLVDYERKLMSPADGKLLITLHYMWKHFAEKYLVEIKAAVSALSLSREKNCDFNSVCTYVRMQPPLHEAVDEWNAKEVEILLKMGTDINMKDRHGETPLTWLLRGQNVRRSPSRRFRETLEVLIYGNPDIEANESAVDIAIGIDDFFMNQSPNFEISGSYIFDGTEHYIHSNEDNYALNFIAPFLIECGFIYSKSILLTSLERCLHPAELDYFRYCLDNPRPLQLACRDTLRRHFKNQDIHEYVRRFAPKNIQDFVLMKDILKARQAYIQGT